MNKRTLTLILALLVMTPTVAGAAQRFGRKTGGFGANRASILMQVWRVPTLSMAQRLQLRDLQASVVRGIQDAGGAGDRRAMRGRIQGALADVERIVGPSHAERARSMPAGPLTPIEIIYYPITALPDLGAERRAKIDAVFAPFIEEARAKAAGQEGAGRRGRQGGEPAEKDRKRQMQALALFDVLEATLTAEQVASVKQFLPERLRDASLRERSLMRLTSLTLEQEMRAKAIFAAVEDETAADKARLKALGGEEKADDASGDRREVRAERRQIRERLDARHEVAEKQLKAMLTPGQVKELESDLPGKPRSQVFTPEKIRHLSLTQQQQRRVGEAVRAFRGEAGDEMMALRDLKQDVDGGDLKSMEMAPVRDKLRKAAAVVERERETFARTVVDTLTAEQIVQLVRSAGAGKAE